MTDKKLTDQEIIKAFRECGQKMNTNYCDECPYNKGMCNDIQMAKDILDLINRQKLKIENLQLHIGCFESKIKRLEDGYAEKMQEYAAVSFHLLKTTKAEAYKEFAERLHEELRIYGTKDKFNKSVFLNVVDRAKKELVGEQK